MVVFPFAFHITVQQPFKSLWYACCYTIMNCLEHHYFVLHVTAVVAIQSQRNFYWNFLHLGISVHKVSALLICLA